MPTILHNAQAAHATPALLADAGSPKIKLLPTKPLSQLIREGAKKRPQAAGHGYISARTIRRNPFARRRFVRGGFLARLRARFRGATCALGAAAEAAGHNPRRALDQEVPQDVRRVVMSLNDTEMMTREEVADTIAGTTLDVAVPLAGGAR